ncbi:MAG: hypothetical protein COY66_01515 [Candidatus Kerfeldbacteria bacterium CG_4_10_14_0_8_um_filter_42_10]|uniref:RNHCP domain-containing protein n=1 Tax=Candidatus Kerfeldbacteria bacterium CG_4_10_14_0_8_um_filter_42_10 TaxID=2014248 RepID=A0A2M7RK27_9BACT|nr:MAG: hypothetical protein COY66_01515 [Candidatus Kerfeldbacteria bacterium CG_4_10_14_0_8_um_filter_42_10]
MKRFIKRKEDFKCGHCYRLVRGDGYTNHCPNCLYSRHVDQNPGDRKSDCGGLMEPVGVIKKNGEIKIIHRCGKCHVEKINRLSADDNQEVLLSIMQ